MFGPIEKYLLDKIKKEKSIHMTLVDPEKITSEQASIVAKNSSQSGTAAIMIGGSTFVSQDHLSLEYDSQMLERCRLIAEIGMGGMLADNTDGSTLYHSSRMKIYPRWARADSVRFKKQIGRHRFYKEL